MNFQTLDISNWARKKQYQFFKQYDNPFFNICSTLDVTELLHQTKNQHLSFSTCLLYASIDAANKVDEFKYRLKDDGVVVFDSIYAGSTILKSDNTFSFSYFDYCGNFDAFYKNAQKEIDSFDTEEKEFDARNTDINIIHYSVIPWITFSNFSHPRNYSTNDSIPKIVFGKYQKRSDKYLLPISIEVHHALMDGYHMGVYLTKLQDLMNSAKFIQK